MKKIYLIILSTIGVALILILNTGCKKYLDAKPDQTLTTPGTVDDLDAILNNYAFINARYPSASEVSSDDYYLLQSDFNTLTDPQSDYYLWKKYSTNLTDYITGYSSVEYANVVLDAIPSVSGDQQRILEDKGKALYVRAAYHFALAQLYCKPYNKNSATTDLGIVIRKTSDALVKPVRTTVELTYQSVINDLTTAAKLLNNQVVNKYTPSKPAAWGLLARVYLSMSDYNNAGKYADSALTVYHTLIDYNTVSVSAAIPFPQFNSEVIYDARTIIPAALLASKAKVDTTLLKLYSVNDLRRSVLFKSNPNGSTSFKGNYAGQNNAAMFAGIATNELYLIRAESYARANNVVNGTKDINTLLQKRWKNGTFTPLNFTDNNLLLSTILNERRKELPFRTLRWIDLRRLNLSEANKITVKRVIGTNSYFLQPNSNEYVFAIDQNAVNISGLQQNP